MLFVAEMDISEKSQRERVLIARNIRCFELRQRRIARACKGCRVNLDLAGRRVETAVSSAIGIRLCGGQ